VAASGSCKVSNKKDFTIDRCAKDSPSLKLFKPSEGAEFQTTLVTSQKTDQLTCGNYVGHYRRLLSDIYGHFTSTVCIAVIQNLLKLTISLTLQLTVKIDPFRT
jgi:hypothetical protein